MWEVRSCRFARFLYLLWLPFLSLSDRLDSPTWGETGYTSGRRRFSQTPRGLEVAVGSTMLVFLQALCNGYSNKIALFRVQFQTQKARKRWGVHSGPVMYGFTGFIGIEAAWQWPMSNSASRLMTALHGSEIWTPARCLRWISCSHLKRGDYQLIHSCCWGLAAKHLQNCGT